MSSYNKTNTVKSVLSGLLILLSVLLSFQAHADTSQMNQTMVRMINQIDALFPLIAKADKEQDKAARVQFHFESWVDSNGDKHDGLKEDLFAIKSALVNQINQANLTPRHIEPMTGDYVGR